MHRILVPLFVFVALTGRVWADAHEMSKASFAATGWHVQLAETDDDTAAIACRNAPSRRCVGDLAIAAASAIEDRMWRDVFMGRVVEVYADSGDIEPVLAAAKFGDAQDRVRSIAQLAASAAKIDLDAARRGFRSAIEIADSIETPMLRLIAYANIAGNAVDAADFETTRLIVDAARSVAGASPELFAHLGLARAQAAIGEVEEALAAVETISDNTSRIRALVQIAEVQAATGNIEAARRVIAAASARAKMIASNSYRYEIGVGCAATLGNRDVALREISQAQARIGDVDAALTTVEYIEDVNLRAGTLSYFAEAPDKARDIETTWRIVRIALAAAAGMDRGGCHNHAMQSIAVAQAKAGDFIAALATVEAIEGTGAGYALDHMAEAWAKSGIVAPTHEVANANFRVKVLTAIARQRIAAGDVNAALAAVEAALTVADEIEEAQQRADALTRIAGARALLGDVAAVRELMRAVLKARNATGDPRWQATTSSLIAKAQLKSGQVTEALATAESIENAWLRVEVLVQIAASLPE